MVKLKLWKLILLASLICLIVSTWLKLTRTETRSGNRPKLLIAAVIFRHGDRNPTGTFPTDPNRNVVWPEGWGRLTRVGAEQLYEVGAYMRRRYASLLEGRYSDDIVFAQSSNLQRTLRSAAICLAGLFPSKNDRIFDEDLSWQSIPIHAISKEKDYIFSFGKTCSRYERAFNKYTRSPQFITLMERYRRMFRELEKRSRIEIRTLNDAKGLYDILWIENLKNKTLPPWGVEALKNEDLKWVVDHAYQIKTNTTVLARLYAGFLIREIVENLQKKIDGSLSPDRSLFLYSASGYAIAKVLNALGLVDAHDPPYASSVHFEVYSLNGEHHIQIIYRASLDDENPSPLQIPSCGTKCSIEKFRRIYSKIIPTGTFDKECQ